jgi:hypothetical protein
MLCPICNMVKLQSLYIKVGNTMRVVPLIKYCPKCDRTIRIKLSAEDGQEKEDE